MEPCRKPLVALRHTPLFPTSPEATPSDSGGQYHLGAVALLHRTADRAAPKVLLNHPLPGCRAMRHPQVTTPSEAKREDRSVQSLLRSGALHHKTADRAAPKNVSLSQRPTPKSPSGCQTYSSSAVTIGDSSSGCQKAHQQASRQGWYCSTAE